MIPGKTCIRVVSAAIIRDGKYLITQRKQAAVLGGMWEFPGGRVEEGETDSEALRRELVHRIGVEAEVREQISHVEREYPDYTVDLYLYRCDIGDAEPTAKNVQKVVWVSSDGFAHYAFTPADEKSMHALLFGT